MASLVAPIFEEKTALVVQTVSQAFTRVAVFEVSGTQACLVSVHGIARAPLGIEISLREQTPLRFALEAASPIVGAGRGPGGEVIAMTLGMSVPRAYTVIPVVDSGRLSALIYADADTEALPLAVVSEAFALCHRTLVGDAKPAPMVARRVRERSVRKPKVVPERRLTVLPPVDDEIESPAGDVEPVAHNNQPLTSVVQASEPVAQPLVSVAQSSEPVAQPSANFAQPVASVAQLSEPAAQRVVTPPALPPRLVPAPAALPPPLVARAPVFVAPDAAQAFVANDDTLLVTPRGVVRRDASQKRARVWPWLLAAVPVAALLALGFVGALLMAPPPTDREQGLTLTIPPKTSLADIARVLEEREVVKSGLVFTWLARALELDRTLRAGTYQLPQGAWAWAVVRELSRGQVHSVRVTVPEGLTLKETAALFEHQGLTSADEFMSAARDKELLEKYDLGDTTAEGFLFPETYTFARGLSAKEMVDAMLEQFFERIARIPEAVRASPEELRERVILASVIEKEARDEGEQPRIAGVFQNRLDKNMKLESCATVLYVLGTPKDRLTLADVRTPSPYNTYLNPGLPPGPIANPGFGAIRAAFRPEKNDYLFFFAKEDGSYQHIFTKTYAEHQREQQKLTRR